MNPFDEPEAGGAVAVNPFDDSQGPPNPFDDSLAPQPDNLKKSGYSFIAGGAQGVESAGVGLSRLEDPGPLRNDFRNFQRQESLANNDLDYRPMDPLTMQPVGDSPELKAQGELQQQQEAARQSLTTPGRAIAAAAAPYVQGANAIAAETPGNETVAKAANVVGGMVPLLAEASVPVIGGPAAVVTGGLQSTGDTYQSAFDAYKKQGMSDDDAQKAADKVAINTGLGSAAAYMMLPGSGKAIAERLLAKQLESATPMVQAAVRTLAQSADGSVVMGADSLMRSAQAMQSYNPDLSWKDALEEAAKSAGTGFVSTAAVHGPMEGFNLARGAAEKPTAESPVRILPSSNEAEETHTPNQTPSDEILDRIRKNVVPPDDQAPASKSDVADLSKQVADLQDALRNPFKASEPTPEEPATVETSQPDAGATVSTAPVASEPDRSSINGQFDKNDDLANSSSSAPEQPSLTPDESKALDALKVMQEDTGLNKVQSDRLAELQAKTKAQPPATEPEKATSETPNTVFAAGETKARGGVQYVSEDKGVADQYAEGGTFGRPGAKTQAYDASGLKVFDATKAEPAEAQAILGKKNLKYVELDGHINFHAFEEDPAIQNRLRESGYNAIKISEGDNGTSIAVLPEAKGSLKPLDGPFSEKANAFADKLESLKTGVGSGGQLHAFGVAADLWDRAISVAQKVIRAGGSVADAINEAVQHIKENFEGQWDEDRARAFLEKNIPTEQDWQTKKTNMGAASQRLKDAITQVASRPAGMTKEEAIQIKNKATAEFHNLESDLLSSPDYAQHLITREQEVYRQLSALLEPAGVKVRPDFMLGREDKLQGVLSEPEMQRAQALNNEWEQLRGQIEKLPKKLVGSIYNKLYPAEPTTGATGAEIPSDWLKAHLGDNAPVEDVKDMTTFGDKAKDAVESLPGNAREAYRGAVKFTDQLKAKYKTIPNRDAISYGKDAADNKATIFSKQVGNVVLHELNRAFGVPKETRNEMRENALSAAVEAGDKKTLALMRDTIDASDNRNTKWAKIEKAAIDYAEKHWDRLDPVRELYSKITDAQVTSENGSGIATLHREGGYVFHLQDINENWAHMDMAEGGGGAAAPFKHIRDHATYADAIAAGVSPKSLNAVDLLQRRVSLGQKLINYRAWQEGLKHYIDPTTELPLVAPVITRARADGTTIDSAPQGYKLVQFAGQKLAMHKGYAGLFEALTGESFFRKNEAGAMLMKAVTTAKHGMLLFDSFHLGRLAFWNSITRGAGEGAGMLLPGNPFSYKEGLTLLDSTVSDIRKMGQTGEIPQDMAQRLIGQRATLDRLINAGLNVGGSSDNIHSDWIQKLPVAGQFNKWLFDKFQRGAMTECALMEFDRQKSMHPELTDDQVARMTAKAVNVRFGNLNSQSVFKSKSYQDLARIAFLAPQWNESLLRAEMGAVKDAGAFVKGAAGGKLVVGTLGRAVATAFIGQFIANQFINLYTRGKPTWENPEEGADAKLSAWVPDKLGHSSGFFLNPLTLPAEMSHLILKGMERTGRFDEAAKQAVTSRLSSLGRFMETMYTGHDNEGNVANTTGQRVALAAKTAAPLPISGSAVYRFGKQLVTGQPAEKTPGQFQRQAMQTFGIKPDNAPTPEGRIYNLAREFNQAHGIEDKEESYHRPYAALDNSVKTGNMDDAKTELKDLLQTHEASTVLKRYEQRTAGRFTGNSHREGQFYATLNPEQRQQYQAAIADRKRVAQVVSSLIRTVK